MVWRTQNMADLKLDRYDNFCDDVMAAIFVLCMQ